MFGDPRNSLASRFFGASALNNSMGHINLVIPWSKIATFLNKMICIDTDLSVINCDEFPVVENRKNMPEDFFIHGLVWSQHYFPVNFFQDSISGDDGRLIEVPSLRTSRIYRCLWLGGKLAKVSIISLPPVKDNQLINLQYFLYSSQSFSITPFAQELEKAAHLDPFATSSDEEIQGS